MSEWPAAADALASRYPFLHQLSERRWWWDEAYNFIFAGGTWLAAQVAVLIDRYIIDGILHLTGKTALEMGRVVRRLQMGQVQAYALAALIGANILLMVVLIW